jgi:glycerol-3-phosphate dehydrogenase
MSEEAADLVTREVAPQLAPVHVTAGMPLPVTEATVRSPAEQIAWAVNHEMAQRLTDILFLSTYWGYERRWSDDELRAMAETMGKLLGWSADRVDAEVSEVRIASPTLIAE